MIRHPLFLHQANGIIVVADGKNPERYFADLAAFQKAEPAYAVPPGAASITIEAHPRWPQFLTRDAAGKPTVLAKDDPIVTACLGYAAKAATYPE